MIELPPYQNESVQSVFDYFSGSDGNPLVVLPTGAGKSLVLASFVKRALTEHPGTKILALTHVKELIIQDVRAILRYWPSAPVGIWSAGVGQKRKAQVTVAGIQSIHKLPAKFADTDLILIDEAHLMSRDSETMYGKFIKGIKDYNDKLKIIGLTATPYRMDSGLLYAGKGRIFTDVCYEAEVGDLIKQGYLCPLVAKGGVTKADLSTVRTRGGEFVPGDLAAVMDKEDLIEGALDEVEKYAYDRQHVLGFTAGVLHAQHCAQACQDRGWSADYVTGEMAAGERDAKIEAFKSGKTRFLFNAMLLTTGFDAPHIDCIIMFRPTKSVGLYVQIMGRGLRKHESKINTLVLDFAGNIARHGPIDQIKVKKEGGTGEGVSVAPAKECPECHELIFASLMTCPACGYEWPVKPKFGTEASDGVIIAAISDPKTYAVSEVIYDSHSKPGKKPSLKVTYLCGIQTFNEWVPIEDERSFVKKHAVSWFWQRGLMCPNDVKAAVQMVRESRIPSPDTITVVPDGKYWRVQKIHLGAGRTDNASIQGGRELLAHYFSERADEALDDIPF